MIYLAIGTIVVVMGSIAAVAIYAFYKKDRHLFTVYSILFAFLAFWLALAYFHNN